MFMFPKGSAYKVYIYIYGNWHNSLIGILTLTVPYPVIYAIGALIGSICFTSCGAGEFQRAIVEASCNWAVVIWEYLMIIIKFGSSVSDFQLKFWATIMNDQISVTSEAPFELPLPKDPVSEIPSEVLKRCFGKQKPSNPHKQRLLVAAAKEAKLDGKSAGKGSGKGKGKGKGKKVPPKKVKVKAKAEPKQITDYSASKAKYIEEFLVSKICKRNWFHI